MSLTELLGDQQQQDGLYERLPLGYLRLLQIRGIVDGMFHCELTAYLAQNAPDFIAISYTWGPPEDPQVMDTPLGAHFPTDTHTIKVSGHDFEIKQNLFDLFEELIMECEGKHYWIDALCINQNDDVEKSEQVQRMGRTYFDATNVLIWLGKAYTCMARVKYIMEQMYKNYDTSMTDINDLEDEQQLERLELEQTNVKDWYNLICFLKRTWFSRMWAVQEFTLAKEPVFRCGPFKLEAHIVTVVTFWLFRTSLTNTVASIWRRYQHSQALLGGSIASISHGVVKLAAGTLEEERDDDIFKGANALYNSSANDLGTPALLNYVLETTMDLKCSDPRDKIFAVLGMATILLDLGGKASLDLEVDYKMDVVDLYRNTMSYLIIGLGSLALLSNSQLSPGHLISGLPSWVTDFSNHNVSDSMIVYDIKHSNNSETFMASKKVQLGFSIVDRNLHVHYFAHATVKDISDTWSQIQSSDSFESVFRLFLTSFQMQKANTISVDDLWRLVLFDITSVYHREFSAHHLRASFRDTILLYNMLTIRAIRTSRKAQDAKTNRSMRYQISLAAMDSTATVLSPKVAVRLYSKWESQKGLLDESSFRFQDLCNRSIRHRRLILLDNGQLGIGAFDTRPGDEVCIIADGVRTPMVLRKAETGIENERLLIGEAYVKGVMYGEAVGQMEASAKTWEKICLV